MFCKNDIKESIINEAKDRLNDGQSLEDINKDFGEELIKDENSVEQAVILQNELDNLISKKEEFINFANSNGFENVELYLVGGRTKENNSVKKDSDLDIIITSTKKPFDEVKGLKKLDAEVEWSQILTNKIHTYGKNFQVLNSLAKGEVSGKVIKEGLKITQSDLTIKPSQELINEYWNANKPEKVYTNEDDYMDMDSWDSNVSEIKNNYPDELEFQTSENEEALNDVADEINDTYPNVIAEVVQDENSNIKVNLNFTEAIPDNLQQVVTKNYSSSEIAKITLNKTLERLSNVFPELRFEFVNPFDLEQEDHLLPVEQINSFIKGNTVYLVDGKFNKESTIDEFLHPFTYGLYEKNRELFDNLYNEVKDNYPEVYSHYSAIGEKEAQLEVVTRALADKVSNPTLWEKFKGFVKRVIQKLFPSANLYSKDISPKTTIGELSDMLTSGKYRFEHYYTQQPFYNAVNDNIKQRNIFTSLTSYASKNGVNKDSEGYTKDGQKTARVTDIVNNNNRETFKNSPLSEEAKLEAELAMEDGTELHAIVDDIMSRYVDKSTGLLKAIPDPNRKSLSKKHIYDLIEKTTLERVKSYPKDTMFAWEVTLHNPGKGALVEVTDAKGNVTKEYRKTLSGTADFVAVTPDNKIHVLDWKFINDKNLEESSKSWKRAAYETQLSNYVDMIKLATGAKDSDFEVVRIVPYIRKYKFNPITKQNELTNLLTPSIDLKQTPHRKMLPYISLRENIENNDIKTFLSKIFGILKVQIEKDRIEGYSNKNDFALQNRIEEAVNDFMVLGDVNRLYDLHVDAANEIEDILKEMNNISKNPIDFSNTEKIWRQLTNAFELIESVNSFKIAAQSIYGENFEKKVDKDQKTEQLLKNKIRILTDRIENYSKNHKDIEIKLSNNIASTEAGISELSHTEKKVSGMINGKFTFLSSPETRSAIYLGTMLSRVYPKLNLIIRGFQSKIHGLLHDVQKEQKRPLKEIYKGLLAYDGEKFLGKFKSRVSTKFWSDRANVIAGGDIPKIQEFFSKYYDFEDIKNRFADRLNKKLKAIDSADIAGTPTEIARIKKWQKDNANKLLNLDSSSEAYTHINAKIIENDEFSNNYHEDWYKDILGENNKSIKAIYDFAMEVNEDLADQGAISYSDKYTFLPNVQKGFIEKGTKNFFSTLKDKFTVNSNSGLYGSVDPINQQLRQRVNIPFTDDFFDGNYDRKSQDILHSYDMVIRGLEKSKILLQLEPLTKTLLRLERNKKVLAVGKTGKILKKPGNPDINADPIVDDANYKYLKQFIDSEIYGRKIQEGWDYQWTTIDDKTGEKRTYSAMSIVQQGLSAMYLKTFGLNVFTPLRTAISGLINNNLLGGKDFKNSDLNSMEAFFTELTSESRKNDKLVAAIGYFLPFINPQFKKEGEKFSMNSLTRWSNFENLTQLMEKSDQIIQVSLANALIKNSIIVDGKIENVRRWVKALPEFSNYLTINKNDPKRIKEIEKEIEERIKEEKINNGVLANSEVKDGNLIIKGLTKEDESISYFTNLVQYYSQKVTGMNPEWNAVGYKNSIAGRLMSTFRTWIPNTVSARYGKFKYNAQVQDYQWGKHIAYWDTIGKTFKSNIFKTIPALLGFSSKTDLINFGMAKYSQMRQTLDEEGRIIGDDFIDEDEFLDTYMNNVTNTINELRIAFSLTLLLLLGFLKGGPDDDDKTKSLKKFARFQLDRMNDEFLFYYNPKSATDILKTAIPAVSYLQQLQRALFALPKEIFDKDDKNPAIKSLLSPIPVASEILRLLPLIDTELAKSLGIRQASVNNFIN